MKKIIKNCPFCGSHAEGYVEYIGGNSFALVIKCASCEIAISTIHHDIFRGIEERYYFESIEEEINKIIDKWNTRV